MTYDEVISSNLRYYYAGVSLKDIPEEIERIKKEL